MEANKELIELYSGLKMTEKVLFAALRKHGLERFDPCEKVEGKAQKFDPKSHEATFMAPSKDMQNGEVMYTQTKGFRLNGRVVRVSFIDVCMASRYFTNCVLPLGRQSRCCQELLKCTSSSLTVPFQAVPICRPLTQYPYF